MELVAKGLGECGWVPIPLHDWRAVLDPAAVKVMVGIQVIPRFMSELEVAMIRALEDKGHLTLLIEGMTGLVWVRVRQCFGYQRRSALLW